MRLLAGAIAVLSAAAVAAGCANGPESASGGGTGSVAEEDLRAAAEVINLGGQEYFLDTLLWRDFTPGLSSTDGLKATVLVKDGMGLPSIFLIQEVWFVNGTEVWRAPLFGRLGKHQALIDNGPQWAPGARVDVVARVLHETAGSTYLLRSAGRAIERVG